MNNKIPTIEESKQHIESLFTFGLDLDERHYEKFIKPIFDKITQQKEEIKELQNSLSIWKDEALFYKEKARQYQEQLEEGLKIEKKLIKEDVEVCRYCEGDGYRNYHPIVPEIAKCDKCNGTGKVV